MTIVYESDHYIIRSHWGDNDSEYIISSFPGVRPIERSNGSFLGAVLAKEFDIPWIGIIPKTDGWYRDGDYIQALSAMKSWIDIRKSSMSKNSVKSIAYGISMGGYAVIKYSRFLKFDYVLAYAPQWSIDPQESLHYSHFKGFYQNFMRYMGITAEDVSGTIYVFFDPHEGPDVSELECLKSRFKVNEIPVCYAGHLVAECLKGRAQFKRILENIDNYVSLTLVVSVIRRYNIYNIKGVVERSAKRFPNLAMKAIFSGRARKSGFFETFFIKDVDQSWDLGTTFLKYGHVEKAFELFSYTKSENKISITKPALISTHGEFLCYEPSSGKLHQTVKQQVLNGSYVIHVDKNKLLVDTPQFPDAIEINIGRVNNNYFLMSDSLFASPVANGSVAMVKHLSPVEEFKILAPSSEDNACIERYTNLVLFNPPLDDIFQKLDGQYSCIWLSTWMNEYLCFNRFMGEFTQTINKKMSNKTIVYLRGNSLFIDGLFGYIHLDADLCIIGERCFIRKHNKFVSIRENGTEMLIDALGEWEQFSIRKIIIENKDNTIPPRKKGFLNYLRSFLK
ncbi:hypothetical protein [Acetobacter cibinongensis]|nr:hypothetical protein [Acetobacter cibinongensis]